MAEVSPGDKVVYGNFVGTVVQLIGDEHCLIGLRTPMSDGAPSVIAKINKCEVVNALPPEEIRSTEPVEEAPPEVPTATETLAASIAEEPVAGTEVEESESVSESPETAEESAPVTEETN